MSRKLRGDLMLFVTALIWGASFVAQKAGMDYIGPFTFNGIRFLLGALVLIPVILIFRRQQQKDGIEKENCCEKENYSEKGNCVGAENNKSGKRDLITGGLSCGVVLFISGTLQQVGMMFTTAGKAGFITALYIVLVPILGLFIGRRVRSVLWFCVALATVGLYLLCVKENLTIGRGDLLMIASAFGFATHILVIDHFSPKADGIKLSCLQFLTAGLISVPCMFLLETINWSSILSAWQPILYSAVMSCGVAYTMQIIAQKDTEPTVASLILSLESVFALIAGIILLHEQVAAREVWGCVIMFAAILLAQFPSKSEDSIISEAGLPNRFSANLKTLPASKGRRECTEKPSRD